jgi:glycosyltransferase involved in cell wall biosynthesis
MSAPVLTLCVIARNEAERLPRCLDSLAPTGALPRETVLVDTGSSDATPAVAAARGARVFHEPWRDDFAAARNAALAHARGEWVLWLDADEELLPASAALLPSLLRDEQAFAYYVYALHVRDAAAPEAAVEMRYLRLHRNHAALRWVGRVHARLEPAPEKLAAEEGRKVLDSTLRFRHWGYLPEAEPAKLQRAARLLELELQDRPGELYYEVELARTWLRLEDPRGEPAMRAALRKVLAVPVEAPPPSILAAPVLEWAVARARRWFPGSPPVLAAIGERYFHAGDYALALPYLERLVEVAERGTYDRSVSFSPHYLADGPLLFLGACRHRLGDLAGAAAAYRRLLERYPGHPSATRNLAAIPAEVGPQPSHDGPSHAVPTHAPRPAPDSPRRRLLHNLKEVPR